MSGRRAKLQIGKKLAEIALNTRREPTDSKTKEIFHLTYLVGQIDVRRFNAIVQILNESLSARD